MKHIFEQVTVGGILSPNRLIRSATQEGLADERGSVGHELISVYKALSIGGSGIIISSMVGIDENSRVFPYMIKAYGDDCVDGMRHLVNAVHSNGGKLVVQLAHCGAKACPDDGSQPLAPSDISMGEKSARNMTKEEINKLAESFAQAALRCREAGADGVQIHAAHGYLLSEFLSPFFNKREDEYGGDIANRARIIFEVYEAVRNKVNNNYPIWIKINCEDFVDGGFTFDECQWVCRELDKRGINALEISGGLSVSPESSATRKTADGNGKGHFSDQALVIAENVKATVISVSGYRTPQMIEQALNIGRIEAVSLCRPLISEPGLPNIWKNESPRPSRCVSCNKCFDFKSGFGCKVFHD